VAQKVAVKIGQEATANSGHMDRVLKVFETVAAQGPLSLNDLSKATQIPRVSAWRAVKCLRERSWVRCRVSDGLFEVTPQVEVLISNARVPLPEIEEVTELLSRLTTLGDYNAAFGVLFALGQFTFLDATHRDDEHVTGTSLVDDIGPAASLLSSSRHDIRRHLAAYGKKCGEDERRQIENGSRERDLVELAETGMVMSMDRRSIAFPWRFATGAIGSIVLSSRQSRRINPDAARALVAHLADRDALAFRLAAE
jgi:hypothetical protein